MAWEEPIPGSFGESSGIGSEGRPLCYCKMVDLSILSRISSIAKFCDKLASYHILFLSEREMFVRRRWITSLLLSATLVVGGMSPISAQEASSSVDERTKERVENYLVRIIKSIYRRTS